MSNLNQDISSSIDSAPLRRMKNNFISDQAGIIESVQLYQTPNARLGVEVPIANNNSMFGSSQLEGCRGDFCDFDLECVENHELKYDKNERIFLFSTWFILRRVCFITFFSD